MLPINMSLSNIIVIFSLFSAVFNDAFASGEVSATSAATRKEWEVAQELQFAAKRVKQSKGHFVCAGIGIINNSALDGEITTFKDDTREFIVGVGMGGCLINPKYGKLCSEQYPPPEWKGNDCFEKYKAHRAQ